MVLVFLLFITNVFAVDVFYEAPTSEEFVELRKLTGMYPRSLESARKGLNNSLFWIILRDQDKLVGMGRVVGDGGTVAQITDISVHPDYQKKGYGAFIFEQIQNYILANIPDDAFVCIFAEKHATPFYKNRRFEYADKWPGMYWPCLDRAKLNGN